MTRRQNRDEAEECKLQVNNYRDIYATMLLFFSLESKLSSSFVNDQ